MKNNDLNSAIEELEKHIKYLLNDYQVLLQQRNTLNEMKAIRMQIKHAEESLRLKKRMRYIFLN
ncbi:MAG: hypothetical protein ABI405_08205 [Parafilimonas sp.]